MKGTVVYGAAMDMSKVFDMVEWSGLFQTLLKRKVGCLYLRLMLFIYANQSCEVKWNNHKSDKFAVNNGVRQGAVSSAYCDRIYRSWNVAIRNIYGVDRTTHRYLIEPLSKSLHPKVMLLSRLVGFYKAQLKSPKMTVRFLIKIAENDTR